MILHITFVSNKSWKRNFHENGNSSSSLNLHQICFESESQWRQMPVLSTCNKIHNLHTHTHSHTQIYKRYLKWGSFLYLEAALLISVIVCAAPLTADHEEHNWPHICAEEGEFFHLFTCLPDSQSACYSWATLNMKWMQCFRLYINHPLPPPCTTLWRPRAAPSALLQVVPPHSECLMQHPNYT